MQTYINLPNPQKESLQFNQYLYNNNIVLQQSKYWILIENKYILKQLVVFSLLPRKYLIECNHLEVIDLFTILSAYKEKHVYINKDKDKSIPNRLHLHIRL